MIIVRHRLSGETMRILLSALVVVALAGLSHAQAASISRIDVTDVGIYQAHIVRTVPAPGTAEGTTNVTSGVKFLKATTRIPARVGVTFGMHYRIVGQPARAIVTLKFVGLVPKPGLHNPATGNTMRRNEFPVKIRLGAVNVTSFTFEHDWELLPGKWAFEIWDGNRRLAAQSFDVYRP